MISSFQELILTIKQRPAMYITCNTISCLKAYLDGWYHRDPASVVDAQLMNDFQEWIEGKFVNAGTQSYSQIILFYSSDEYSALKQFFKLFDDFLQIKKL